VVKSGVLGLEEEAGGEDRPPSSRSSVSEVGEVSKVGDPGILRSVVSDMYEP